MTKKEEKTSNTLYIRQAANSFGGGVINPYVPIYAVQLGANASEMGCSAPSTTYSATSRKFHGA